MCFESLRFRALDKGNILHRSRQAAQKLSEAGKLFIHLEAEMSPVKKAQLRGEVFPDTRLINSVNLL